MPMIEVTYPVGSIEDGRRAELLDELAGALLRWEGAPDTELIRSITWVYATEIDPAGLAVGGRPGGQPRFRVDVTVPLGALSDRRKAGLAKDATALVLAAAGLAREDGMRVWTIFHEVPDGNWAAAGEVVRFAELAALAEAERTRATSGT